MGGCPSLPVNFHRLRYAGVLCLQRITGDSNEALAGVASLYAAVKPYYAVGLVVGGSRDVVECKSSSRIGNTCIAERKHSMKALLLRKQGFLYFRREA